MIYRKKPIEIESIQLTLSNVDEVIEFCKGEAYTLSVMPKNCLLYISTLEGTMRASEGDFIIKGIKGEYYPCKPDIFEASYTKVLD